MISPVKNPDLFERGEIVALFNTFNRFSESVHAIKVFRKMYTDKFLPKVIITMHCYKISKKKPIICEIV